MTMSNGGSKCFRKVGVYEIQGDMGRLSWLGHDIFIWAMREEVEEEYFYFM